MDDHAMELSSNGSPVKTTPPMMTRLEMALRFLKLGSIGFGGGVAVIALMEQECVRRRTCVETEEFLHGVGLGQILGPFAVNTAFFIGYRMFGLGGALLAQAAFLAPSVSLVIGLSWLYFSFNQIPSLQGALAGLAPVVIALILSAAWSMGRKSIQSTVAIALLLVAVGGSLARINPVWILAIAGVVGYLLKLDRSRSRGQAAYLILPLPLLIKGLPHTLSAALPATSTLMTVGLLTLAMGFLKVGVVFFGGGFVLIPVLHQQLVTQLGWLTPQEFIDGVAISQLTPGPMAVLATFTGYRMAGIAGALVATVALFLPATLLMWGISHFYQQLRQVTAVKDFLAGVNPVVVGLILAAAIALAPSSLHWERPLSLVLGAIALVLFTRFKWHPAFVLAIGALTGTLASAWI
ncbi:chromate efflux transporter [Leptothermofonsia sp. ETS-13]|uniref:chromate efflux transporter n=1 Tax=Leptothermofonsia sp. ETS-13 TaxID=3035696 RepID=UPI003B9E9539